MPLYHAIVDKLLVYEAKELVYRYFYIAYFVMISSK